MKTHLKIMLVAMAVAGLSQSASAVSFTEAIEQAILRNPEVRHAGTSSAPPTKRSPQPRAVTCHAWMSRPMPATNGGNTRPLATPVSISRAR